MESRHPAEPHGVSAIVKVISVCSSISNTAFVLSDISAARGCVGTVCVLCVFSDNVDHAIDGVRSPNRAARPTNYFDPLHIFQHHVLNVPIDTGKKRSVNAPAINQHQHRPGECASKATDTDRPGIGINARHLNPGYKPQDFRNAGGSGTSNLFLSENVNCGGGLPDLFGFLRC